MNKKTVLITGASRGIGKQTALLFSREQYHVFLNCSSSRQSLEEVGEEIARYGGSSSLYIGDVGCPDFVREMFSRIYDETSALDVLVNNAGISHVGLLSDMSDAEWDRVIRTNLSSVFYCCRSAIPNMVSRKKGKIINISSIWGVSGASCEAAYSASKAGVNGLTQALARELAPSNIQVNALAFGVIDTEMNARLSPEEHEELRNSIPTGRYGTPAEAAEMILDIMKAPSYLTGQIINFDGGL